MHTHTHPPPHPVSLKEGLHSSLSNLLLGLPNLQGSLESGAIIPSSFSLRLKGGIGSLHGWFLGALSTILTYLVNSFSIKLFSFNPF